MGPLALLLLALESVVQVVGVRAGVEQPPYRMVERHGALELREYPPRVVAEVTVTGPAEAARNAGFRKVAAYIFGANGARGEVAMTSPVVQRGGQALAMTAPVVQATPVRDEAGQAWTIQFVMPAKYTLQSLPAPNDPEVRLKAEPAARYAVIRYAGDRSGAAVAARTAALLDQVRAQGWKTRAAPVAWFYDPPWTLPPFRRNEVAVEVE